MCDGDMWCLHRQRVLAECFIQKVVDVDVGDFVFVVGDVYLKRLRMVCRCIKADCGRRTSSS